MKVPGEWKPADATTRIRTCAASDDLDLDVTDHAREQMRERDIIMGDLLFLLKTGFVYDAPVRATREGYFRYAVEGATPSSDGRSLRAIVIPSGGCELKIVTVMWRDER